MKTKSELEEKIKQITSVIHKEYPELSKYIMEMPMNSSGKDGVTVKDLEDYYQSLEEYVAKYVEAQSAKGDK